MRGFLRDRLTGAWRLIAHSLSGRLLVWTILYVLISEVLIFVPAIGIYHRELLDDHIQSAELAVLPFTEPGGNGLSLALRGDLLKRAGADAVLLNRADQRELFQVRGMPQTIDRTIDLTRHTFLREMMGGMECLLRGGNRTLHVIAPTRIAGAQTIGIILGEAPIRAALVVYARRIVAAALFISIVTAGLVFTSLYFALVRPMRRVTQAMVAFRENPEDASRILSATRRKGEIGMAERELAAMQRDIYAFLQQKTRLAALGAAIARIQHDLRNVLANAQLASDRMAASDDPVVKKLAPRLIASIDRAIALATSTLRYGRAQEHPPERKSMPLAALLDEAAEAAMETRLGARGIAFQNRIGPEIRADIDPEQFFRIALNLLRNALEALADREGGVVTVSAARDGHMVAIDFADNGPGIAPAMAARLFQPFASGHSGGSGLGLAIARDLARAHGGDALLVSTGAGGSLFRVTIPDRAEAV